MQSRADAPRIRKLDPLADRQLVAELLDRCSDYILLETGSPPDDGYIREFFEDVPPGRRIDDALKLGIFDDDRIVGLLDIYRGYPRDEDWYIGLLLLDKGERNRGLGQHVLEWIVQSARSEKARRLLLCVLEANRRGQAFWERHGFHVLRVVPPGISTGKAHVRIEMHKQLDPEK